MADYNPFNPNDAIYGPGGGGFGGGGGGGGFGSPFSMNPLAMGLDVGSGLLGLFAGAGAKGTQKKLLDEQLRLARSQYGQYLNVLPAYNQALAGLEQYAGLGSPDASGNTPYANQAQFGNFTKGGQTFADWGSRRSSGVGGAGAADISQNPAGTQNGWLMGPYANQNYQLLRAQSEQDVEHQMQNADRNLTANLMNQGISTGSRAAALGQEHTSMLQNYADYNRNLAIQAGQQYQQRLQAAMGAMAPSLGMAAPAESILGQQGAIYGNQAQAGFGAAGQALGNLAQYAQLSQMMNSPAGMYGMNPMMMYGGMMGMNPYATGAMNYGGGGAYGY